METVCIRSSNGKELVRSAVGSSSEQQEEKRAVDENCPWCTGSGYVWVFDAVQVEKDNRLDGYMEVKPAVLIPGVATCCVRCMPEGLQLRKNRHVPTLKSHLEWMTSCMPREYSMLAVTHLIISLMGRMSQEAAEALVNSLDITGATSYNKMQEIIDATYNPRNRAYLMRKAAKQGIAAKAAQAAARIVGDKFDDEEW